MYTKKKKQYFWSIIDTIPNIVVNKHFVIRVKLCRSMCEVIVCIFTYIITVTEELYKSIFSKKIMKRKRRRKKETKRSDI